MISPDVPGRRLDLDVDLDFLVRSRGDTRHSRFTLNTVQLAPTNSKPINRQPPGVVMVPPATRIKTAVEAVGGDIALIKAGCRCRACRQAPPGWRSTNRAPRSWKPCKQQCRS